MNSRVTSHKQPVSSGKDAAISSAAYHSDLLLTALYRDNRDIQERLTICENQRRANECAVTKLQAALGEQREIAAAAQIRVEKYRKGNQGIYAAHESGNQEERDQVVDHSCPKATAFLQTYIPDTPARGNQSDTGGPNPTLLSNSSALEHFRAKMAQELQEQIASTKYVRSFCG